MLIVRCFRACNLLLLVAAALGLSGQKTRASQAVAAGPPGLTIEQAVAMALEHSPGLRASNARVQAAAGRAYQTGKWSNPELELTAEEWPVRHGGRGFSGAKQTIGISQTLPFPGKKANERLAGRAGVKVSEAQSSANRITLVRDVRIGFFRVLAGEQLVVVARELHATADSSAGIARKRVEAGAAPYQEQLRAEIQLEQARTDLMGLQQELAASRHMLASLIGRPELHGAQWKGQLVETPDAALLDARLEALATDHPEVVSAQARLEQARADYQRARLEPYPDTTATLAGGRLGETDESIVELTFSLPLPVWDRAKGRKQEAAALLAEAEADLAGARLAVIRDSSVALEKYRSLVQRARHHREEVLPKLTEALRLVQTGFEEGKFGFIDLVDTQRTAAEARLSYQKTLLEMNVSQAELEALVRTEKARLPAPRERKTDAK